MTLKLMSWHKEVLKILPEGCGILAREVGATVWKNLPARSASAVATVALVELEVEGFVKRLDQERPIAWCRTETGRAVLQIETGMDPVDRGISLIASGSEDG